MAVGRPVITGIDWSLYPQDPPPVIAAGNADAIAAAVEKLRNDERELARLSREWQGVGRAQPRFRDAPAPVGSCLFRFRNCGVSIGSDAD